MPPQDALAAVVVSIPIPVSATHLLRHELVIATPEGITVFVAQIAGNIRMTVFVAVVYIRTAMVIHVFACAYHAILKPTMLDLAALSPSPILSVATTPISRLVITVHWLLNSTIQVGNSNFITPSESVSVGFALFAWKAWISVLVAVIHIGPTVIVSVLARTFDAIMKTLPLDFL